MIFVDKRPKFPIKYLNYYIDEKIFLITVHLRIIAAEEVSGEAAVAIVGGGHGLVLGVEGRDGRHGAEDLLPPAAHVALAAKPVSTVVLRRASTSNTKSEFSICF